MAVHDIASNSSPTFTSDSLDFLRKGDIETLRHLQQVLKGIVDRSGEHSKHRFIRASCEWLANLESHDLDGSAPYRTPFVLTSKSEKGENFTGAGAWADDIKDTSLDELADKHLSTHCSAIRFSCTVVETLRTMIPHDDLLGDGAVTAKFHTNVSQRTSNLDVLPDDGGDKYRLIKPNVSVLIEHAQKIALAAVALNVSDKLDALAISTPSKSTASKDAEKHMLAGIADLKADLVDVMERGGAPKTSPASFLSMHRSSILLVVTVITIVLALCAIYDFSVVESLLPPWVASVLSPEH